jgi:ribulose-5-phosphate 4-epimerase/fuculose-1-phosphate aldolase
MSISPPDSRDRSSRASGPDRFLRVALSTEEVNMLQTDPTRIRHTQTAADNDVNRRALELADTTEARHLKVKLAAAYRMIARQGLDAGVAGHISLRVPGAPDYFWVNPFGLLFREVTADNLILINGKGEIVGGGKLINYAAFCIHAAIHHARADVHCAVHTHPPAGAAYSALAIPLEPLDQTGCSFFEDHGVFSEYDGIVLGTKRALILANHGLLTCAPTVEQALVDMLDLERTCALNLRALSTGKPVKVVPPEAARQARAVLTQPMRWPFTWQAMIRELNRHETDYDPHGWGE